ncbi:putative carbohydrate-binding module family 48 protein, partial [Golovinomyces cichoracearum]
MGSFIFTWEHPADEVYVTGTFDDWSKSERLEKTNTIFAKRVFLNNVSEKIYYKDLFCFFPTFISPPNHLTSIVLLQLQLIRLPISKFKLTNFYLQFVVDGNWITDHTAPQENDESGNLNNVLTADRITMQKFDTVGAMSGVTPESSSVPLAASVPLEKGKRNEPDTLPGTFPETSAAEGGLSEYLMNTLSATEMSTASVNDSFNSNTDKKPTGKDEEEQTFSVSPLPAFPGAVNPVSISPGEKLPDFRTLTSDTLTSNVDLGKDEEEQTFSVSPLP